MTHYLISYRESTGACKLVIQLILEMDRQKKEVGGSGKKEGGMMGKSYWAYFILDIRRCNSLQTRDIDFILLRVQKK